MPDHPSTTALCHGQLHASSLYKGCQVDVDVTRERGQPGSCAVIVVAAPPCGNPSRTLEYVFDLPQLDEAAGAGLQIARSLIDEHLLHASGRPVGAGP
ncbi:MAG TPA: hypothetical protein VLA16_04665 [Ideonella sp.]|nr:hypothetical protein [Ideonella sp.]